MTKDKFWEVIDNARAIAPALEGEPLRESLYKQLLKLSPDELVGFDCAWQEYRRIANSPQLIAAACIINGGTSDDRFDYFKNWLILQGQYAFRQALQNPDTLAALRITFDDTEWEDCGYLTSLAFVGRALPTYFAQEGIAKELRRKYPALLQAPGALDAEIMRVLLYPNREQEQAFDRYLLGLEVQHYIDISGLDSYDKFYFCLLYTSVALPLAGSIMEMRVLLPLSSNLYKAKEVFAILTAFPVSVSVLMSCK